MAASEEAESGEFGELITGDHLIARIGPTGSDIIDGADRFGLDVLDAKVAAVLYDRGTGWVQCYPKGTKTKEDTADALQDFKGQYEVKKFYADNAGELQEAAKWLHWPRGRAVPGDHQSTGLAERFIGIVKKDGQHSKH